MLAVVRPARSAALRPADRSTPQRARTPQKRLFSGPLDGDGRRSIYTKMSRSWSRRGFWPAFNQPPPKIPDRPARRDQRARQALALLNDPFVLGQAEALGEAARAGLDTSPAERASHAMFARRPRTPPSDAEWPQRGRSAALARPSSERVWFRYARWRGRWPMRCSTRRSSFTPMQVRHATCQYVDQARSEDAHDCRMTHRPAARMRRAFLRDRAITASAAGAGGAAACGGRGRHRCTRRRRGRRTSSSASWTAGRAMSTRSIHKPALDEARRAKPIGEIGGLETVASRPPSRVWFGSPWKFRAARRERPVGQRSACRTSPSVADDLCVVRSMVGEQPLHGQQNLLLHTGRVTGQAPSLGSWVSYGLGTENDEPAGLRAAQQRLDSQRRPREFRQRLSAGDALSDAAPRQRDAGRQHRPGRSARHAAPQARPAARSRTREFAAQHAEARA